MKKLFTAAVAFALLTVSMAWASEDHYYSGISVQPGTAFPVNPPIQAVHYGNGSWNKDSGTYVSEPYFYDFELFTPHLHITMTIGAPQDENGTEFPYNCAPGVFTAWDPQFHEPNTTKWRWYPAASSWSKQGQMAALDGYMNPNWKASWPFWVSFDQVEWYYRRTANPVGTWHGMDAINTGFKSNYVFAISGGGYCYSLGKLTVKDVSTPGVFGFYVAVNSSHDYFQSGGGTNYRHFTFPPSPGDALLSYKMGWWSDTDQDARDRCEMKAYSDWDKAYWIGNIAIQCKGDTNLDGSVNGLDVSHFNQAINHPADYPGDHAGVPAAFNADMNLDGNVDGLDVSDFSANVTVASDRYYWYWHEHGEYWDGDQPGYAVDPPPFGQTSNSSLKRFEGLAKKKAKGKCYKLTSATLPDLSHNLDEWPDDLKEYARTIAKRAARHYAWRRSELLQAFAAHPWMNPHTGKGGVAPTMAPGEDDPFVDDRTPATTIDTSPAEE